ncbi:SRPBCC domain-containing protein [Aquincola sp. S2]|uniref:glutathione transferase n=1 Tax=Pseudaquabacterium terrae TaxID=2732868 RepID=A0ABX2EEL8_9BURK|nr:SRPBCC domain-containing protein [Aquabacterium terrae]NRF67065.1 SRPBCC domain-containing protein [Aquabacterium terrae]
MNAPNETFELTLTRFIRAPREKVYDAFVTPSLMAAWNCPRGMVVEASAEAHVGGAYRLQMRARDGTRFEVNGHYVELKRPERLSYTWTWAGGGPMPEGLQTLIEVELIARDGGTALTMRHSGFPTAALRDSHTHGWTGCLNKLNDLLDPEGTAGTLTLLGDPRSSYVRTARMAFAEKGVAITLKPLAPNAPEVVAVHPFARIPVLLDGPTAMWETRAILQFADESFGDSLTLTPGRISDRVACEQWVSAVNCYLYDTMVRRYVLPYIFPKGEGDRAVIERAVAEMPAQLAALERAYERSDTLAGQSVSFADLFVAPILAYVERFPEGKQLLGDMPNIRRAQAVMRQRPSFIATDPQAR